MVGNQRVSSLRSLDRANQIHGAAIRGKGAKDVSAGIIAVNTRRMESRKSRTLVESIERSKKPEQEESRL